MLTEGSEEDFGMLVDVVCSICGLVVETIKVGDEPSTDHLEAAHPEYHG